LNNRVEPNLPDDPAWPSIAQRRARKILILSHYKFYLAFENAPIEDYVSEKVIVFIFIYLLIIFSWQLRCRYLRDYLQGVYLYIEVRNPLRNLCQQKMLILMQMN
jgi:hypothetical protein